MIGAAFGGVLARAQAGDEAAFAGIFRDLQRALLRYLRVITPALPTASISPSHLPGIVVPTTSATRKPTQGC